MKNIMILRFITIALIGVLFWQDTVWAQGMLMRESQLEEVADATDILDCLIVVKRMWRTRLDENEAMLMQWLKNWAEESDDRKLTALVNQVTRVFIDDEGDPYIVFSHGGREVMCRLSDRGDDDDYMVLGEEFDGVASLEGRRLQFVELKNPLGEQIKVLQGLINNFPEDITTEEELLEAVLEKIPVCLQPIFMEYYHRCSDFGMAGVVARFIDNLFYRDTGRGREPGFREQLAFSEGISREEADGAIEVLARNFGDLDDGKENKGLSEELISVSEKLKALYKKFIDRFPLMAVPYSEFCHNFLTPEVTQEGLTEIGGNDSPGAQFARDCREVLSGITIGELMALQREDGFLAKNIRESQLALGIDAFNLRVMVRGLFCIGKPMHSRNSQRGLWSATACCCVCSIVNISIIVLAILCIIPVLLILLNPAIASADPGKLDLGDYKLYPLYPLYPGGEVRLFTDTVKGESRFSLTNGWMQGIPGPLDMRLMLMYQTADPLDRNRFFTDQGVGVLGNLDFRYSEPDSVMLFGAHGGRTFDGTGFVNAFWGVEEPKGNGAFHFLYGNRNNSSEHLGGVAYNMQYNSDEMTSMGGHAEWLFNEHNHGVNLGLYYLRDISLNPHLVLTTGGITNIFVFPKSEAVDTDFSGTMEAHVLLSLLDNGTYIGIGVGVWNPPIEYPIEGDWHAFGEGIAGYRGGKIGAQLGVKFFPGAVNVAQPNIKLWFGPKDWLKIVAQAELYSARWDGLIREEIPLQFGLDLVFLLPEERRFPPYSRDNPFSPPPEVAPLRWRSLWKPEMFPIKYPKIGVNLRYELIGEQELKKRYEIKAEAERRRLEDLKKKEANEHMEFNVWLKGLSNEEKTRYEAIKDFYKSKEKRYDTFLSASKISAGINKKDFYKKVIHDDRLWYIAAGWVEMNKDVGDMLSNGPSFLRSLDTNSARLFYLFANHFRYDSNYDGIWVGYNFRYDIDGLKDLFQKENVVSAGRMLGKLSFKKLLLLKKNIKGMWYSEAAQFLFGYFVNAARYYLDIREVVRLMDFVDFDKDGKSVFCLIKSGERILLKGVTPKNFSDKFISLDADARSFYLDVLEGLGKMPDSRRKAYLQGTKDLDYTGVLNINLFRIAKFRPPDLIISHQ